MALVISAAVIPVNVIVISTCLITLHPFLPSFLPSFPQEEAPSRRSVAELAGRFKGSAAPHDAAGQEAVSPKSLTRAAQLSEDVQNDKETQNKHRDT